MPIRWETHAAPAQGQRPQQLINDRVAANCDILIGIFWARLGTPTGEAESGTVEEIRNHVKAEKPALIYFSNAPLPQDHDPEQFQRLRKFKEECQQSGLIWPISDLRDFKQQVTKHLEHHLQHDSYLKKIIEAAEAKVQAPTPKRLSGWA